MAVLVSKTMGELNEERKPVHPFFDRSSRTLGRLKKETPRDAETTNITPVHNRNTESGAEILASNSNIAASNGPEAQYLEVDPNDGRRKRQKTDSPGAGAVELPPVVSNDPGMLHTLKDVPTEQAAPSAVEEERLSSPQSLKVVEDQVAATKAKTLEPGESNDDKDREISDAVTASTKPRKILLLNTKTGTIGSPPKKLAQPFSIVKKSTPRNRKLKSFIITIRYGEGQRFADTLGTRIDQILKDVKIESPPEVMESQMKLPSKAASSTAAPRTTHPFFLGKKAGKESAPPKNDEPSKQQTTATPTLNKSIAPQKPITKPTGPFLVFGNTNKTMKFPGAIEPAWPWRDMVHIHGHESVERPSCASDPGAAPSDTKKSKYPTVEVLETENVLNRVSSKTRLHALIEGTKSIDTDTFTPPPACLRMPQKHFESGRALQPRVRKQLHTKIPTTKAAYNSLSEDELQQDIPIRSKVHPALSKTFESIATSLSAFDRCECETQCWAQKYAPKCADDVLQSGREALLLKEWLQRLTVTSVDTGDKQSRQSSSSSKRSGAAKPEKSGKRKRKCKDLEGFVVSSDEENSYMDEISDPEDSDIPHGSDSLYKKSLIRTGDALAKGSKDPARLTNTVVISGPSGCGKTAAVYAVAKELGFEVFEISPNSRRSGKDVLEKVGDMTRNHLVQQSRDGLQKFVEDDDSKRISDALAEDLRTGRQGTMNSFFKKKEPTAPERKSVKNVTNKGDDKAKGTSKQQKQQKQSLILLEEVDILYEEDKQFWATIVSMMSQSKRPIIMTCNNESAIPLQALALHAIIRFNPPPTSLAVDYLLLVAANEGHLIHRKAVEALYESRHMDLRASVMELNFWCQFAIGDRKGGLDWFYPRWPRGSDVDNHGDTVRVVSEDSYQTGVGWLCNDFLHSGHESECERMRETLDGWDLDVGDWHENLDFASWADAVQSRQHANTLSDLYMYEEFTRTMSDSNILSGPYFAPDEKEPVDVSLPPLSGKAREDYILGYELLEASPQVFYNDIRVDISIWLKSEARECLAAKQTTLNGDAISRPLKVMNDEKITQLIKSKSNPQTIDPSLNRRDFSIAFDPISEPEKSTLHTTGNLEASAFDRPLNVITLDLAPYVRSIVSYDMRLQRERHRLSGLLSESGARSKRMRTTRAAMSALEGGSRSTTRREKYFSPDLNPHLVMKTGEQSWMDAALLEMKTQEKKMGSRRSSITEGSSVVDELSEGGGASNE
ncbi:hypothetical protein F5884DRAFT_301971 [Xylogone sp. PMI_703]|nr:hypothetical protein F5884DRAFT_301971 [Xylogone sp. PMI_703]